MRAPVSPVVRVWRTSSTLVDAVKVRRSARHPVAGVVRDRDVRYAPGDGAGHLLDVLRPARPVRGAPVLVSFHGGGWTNGDKRVTDAYCATQAAAGAVVVNANYRLADRVGGDHAARLLEDAAAVLRWTRAHAEALGGDPGRIVVGGDSAGGQIAALLVAAGVRSELAAHFGLEEPVGRVRGLVQHSSFADLGVGAGRWSPARGLVRLLLPEGGRGLDPIASREALHRCSPVEQVSPDFPPTFVTTSARDFLRRASLALIDRLRQVDVPVEALVLGRAHDRVLHTFQQDVALRESLLVHEHLARFLRRVTR